MSEKDLANDLDILEAMKYWNSKSDIFDFPTLGNMHYLPLRELTYIGPITSEGGSLSDRSGRNSTTYFDVGIKHTGILRLVLRKQGIGYDDTTSISDYTYQIHRGMIQIWKKIHDSDNM